MPFARSTVIAIGRTAGAHVWIAGLFELLAHVDPRDDLARLRVDDLEEALALVRVRVEDGFVAGRVDEADRRVIDLRAVSRVGVLVR